MKTSYTHQGVRNLDTPRNVRTRHVHSFKSSTIAIVDEHTPGLVAYVTERVCECGEVERP